MKEKMDIVKELNMTPLGRHALKLLEEGNEFATNDELYLVQVARQITEHFLVQEYVRNNLMLLTHNNLLEDLYDMYDKNPEAQIEMMLNEDGNGSEEDLLKCTELHQMALVIMQTMIDKREEKFGSPYDKQTL